ncbi:Lyso-phosphatidylcholine acyltransferase [Elasticomyces elasticus]|nr:Lyso-phosphatidylcholine acyltransferase [Elasticomyces elasticus]KAK3655312.1 Lyso-phosphatidylcholine acyltransferase [Elasticomyces elasticus]KAK4918668.1 Lyso-phosphatidylcholine acyltransferase [Elasticomyces elasticus]KAK5751960.1 Lyso-phosphatidylcholine acyltransferase [Elasticomyces elasticus]
MAAEERTPPYQPSLARRIATTAEIGIVAALSRTFLYALNGIEAPGLEKFLDVLDSRYDESKRERGLITVTTGVLGICGGRTGRLQTAFFSYGNTLPTHRLAHSPHGGLFQPTITECIRLLSNPHGKPGTPPSIGAASQPPSDPFSSGTLTYSTTGSDAIFSPSAYPANRFSWIHIFPEGMTHQHPDHLMRYFKWGVARLILESEPCPDVIPIWIDGPQEVMSYERTWPRFIPRANKDIEIRFGDLVDREKTWSGFRQRWAELKDRARRKRELSRTTDRSTGQVEDSLGVVNDDELRYGEEARQLRTEVTLAVRNEVLKVRRAAGWGDEDPKRGLAETYRLESGGVLEGEKVKGRGRGVKHGDGSGTEPV